MSKPLRDLQEPVRALFTDLDGTMVADGQLTAEILSALWSLFDAGLPVVLVTGRPAGWGHALASLLPFSAVITENGGVSFVPWDGGMRKLVALPANELATWRSLMQRAAQDIARDFPGARLSLDSAYREFDLAIDWNEDVHLSAEQADEIVGVLHKLGLAASRSSVHVNYGPPNVDKWVACQKILETCFPGLSAPFDEVVYVGDSLNDAPVFGALRKSVGVANVRERWEQLPHQPKYIAPSAEGAGFCELASRLLTLG
ncbi:MAG: HAD-IIB family hydrolase [Myxococcales bacterium]|nr:HAD-IIB family hydrolase [Myxococcales bacterium]